MKAVVVVVAVIPLDLNFFISKEVLLLVAVVEMFPCLHCASPYREENELKVVYSALFEQSTMNFIEMHR